MLRMRLVLLVLISYAASDFSVLAFHVSHIRDENCHLQFSHHVHLVSKVVFQVVAASRCCRDAFIDMVTKEVKRAVY